jgi:predicted Rossmann fold nucleotide-binding protein DprA/Smf involved in DNA uptake
LIKSASAKLVQQWQDVVSELPEEIGREILPPVIDKKDKQPAQMQLAPADLSEREMKIWQLLSTDEPTHIDILIEASGLSVGDLSTALLGLEIRELIRAFPGKCFARKV